MIIASDLDRTLVYSQRAIEQLGLPNDTSLKPVEKKSEQWVSYMTETSFSILEEICRHSLFIPVTTRTEEQFERIAIFQGQLPAPYAITSNGANIHFKGKKLRDWSEHISFKLNKECAGKEEVYAFFQKRIRTSNAVIKQVEDLFFYFIFDRLPDDLDKQSLKDAAAEFGWKVSLQGRKLYFIPKPINKGDALRYICDRVGMYAAAGAGDSILDWDFLTHCKHQYIPRHGELAGEMDIHDSSVIITKKEGVLAGEEILQHFHSLLAISN